MNPVEQHVSFGKLVEPDDVAYRGVRNRQVAVAVDRESFQVDCRGIVHLDVMVELETS